MLILMGYIILVRCPRHAEVCLDRTLQECGPCWLGVLMGRAIKGMECTVQVLAAHCVLKQCSCTVASPGTMPAPALSADREQQQQHILTQRLL
jgi:hypothetical protein